MQDLPSASEWPHGGGAGSRARGTSALTVSGLTLVRGGRAVLDCISFELAAGRLLAVVGPSGAGKSSLLAAIAGFERCSAGTINSFGTNLTAQPAAARGIGMSFDDAALHEHLTVAENIDAAARARGEPRERRASRVAALAHALGIGELLGRMPASISAGERRRVAVARAFVGGHRLVMLDEPFANLDAHNRLAVRQMIRGLKESTGASVVVVSHDASDAIAIADDVLAIADGRVLASGTADAVTHEPPSLLVAQLVDELGWNAIETDAPRGSADCEVGAALEGRLRGFETKRRVILAVSPWKLHADASTPWGLRFASRIAAHERAGPFTDVIALRPDRSVVRARLSPQAAQELPIGATVWLHARDEDIHLFLAPWPGVRPGK